MRVLVFDTETDGLLPDATRIWCLGVGDPSTGDITVYADQVGYPPIIEGLNRLSQADRIVGHNAIGFDFPIINRFYPGHIRFPQVFDTLILSRMIDPERRDHTLSALGELVGEPKAEFSDFSAFSEEMARYLQQDIRTTIKVYNHLIGESKHSDLSIEVEHKVALAISLQEQHGFPFDLPKAVALEAELRAEKEAIEDELQRHFRPMWVALSGAGKSEKFPGVDDITKCVKVAKTNRSPYAKDAPFTPVDLRSFNPGSRRHIEVRLRLMGWKPTKFTASGAAQIDGEVLSEIATIYHDAAPLARHARVLKLLGQLTDGDNAWLKLYRTHPDGTHRVHGRVNTIGAGTHRMSHWGPNLAQVDKKDARMREVWVTTPGRVMVGTDADAIEARGLGHYLAALDKGAFAWSVDQGKKSDGTDIHTRNLKATRMRKRDLGMCVKNLFYAYLGFLEAA